MTDSFISKTPTFLKTLLGCAHFQFIKVLRKVDSASLAIAKFWKGPSKLKKALTSSIINYFQNTLNALSSSLVSYSPYRDIFNAKYNTAFGYRQSDTCPICDKNTATLMPN